MRKLASGVVMAMASCAVAMTLGGAPASATSVVVFQDSFDVETGSGQGANPGSEINHTTFLQWTVPVPDGTVDLIANGDFGIDCFGGAGKCVDLDGATNDAGVLTSDALNLAAGSYEFSFQLAGTDSGFTQTNAKIPNIVDVSIGGLFATTITANWGDPFAEYGGSFDVLVPTIVSIVFANQGGDQFGAMLDSVKLEMVPEPAAAALLALGLGGLGALGRRRA